ncbi:MBL fold metallo-hydrolase [Anaerotardibacter muris]|uniref:MBL fold metallo-hydrolase n=1 Tax=Anaerotardibacter muris TaxID=2941505 RepID=UPI002040881C|nr:MBL fold metallo-hydrolase [Anaerotardibacter muris]
MAEEKKTKRRGADTIATLGQVDPEHATYFTYTKEDGSEVRKLVRYPEVTFERNYLLHEDAPGIFHSSYKVNDFYFTDRIDEFVALDPGKQALFVDVGYSDLCGVEFLDEALDQQGIDWHDAELFITHSHDDHDGNTRYCLDKGARKVYIGFIPDYEPSMTTDYMTMTGIERFPHNDKLSFYVDRLLNREGQFDGYEDRVQVMHEGDRIEVGDYSFEVLETPGHTVDHLCLLDREKGILFAGDHILDTAPGLMSYYADIHLLKRYLDSIAHLKTLGLNHVFMCHTDSLEGAENINAFLDKILATYERPIQKMESMLETKPLTVYELAKKYYSYLPDWEGQPPILLSRRVSIAFSYLDYLYDTGRCRRRRAEDGAFEYWVD